MRAAVTPAHLLLLDHAFADHLVDRGFHERGGDDLAGAVALPVVGYGRGVRGEVPAELAYRLGEFVLPGLVLLAAGVLVFEVGGDVVDGLQRAKDVAVPQKPLQPLQLGGEGGRRARAGRAGPWPAASSRCSAS